MKLVRKVSRKRYFHRAMYEHERILVPVPSRDRDAVRLWLGRDLRVLVEPLADGFALLVLSEDQRIEVWPLSNRFRRMMQQLRSESEAKMRSRENVSGVRIDQGKNSSETP